MIGISEAVWGYADGDIYIYTLCEMFVYVLHIIQHHYNYKKIHGGVLLKHIFLNILDPDAHPSFFFFHVSLSLSLPNMGV